MTLKHCMQEWTREEILIKCLILLVILFTGCSVKTTIVDPDGRAFTINSKRNAIVSFKEGKTDITIDNRGKRGIISEVFGALLIDARTLNKEIK